VLRDQDVRALEDYHFRRDGSMFPIRCSATPIVVDGVVQGALLELLDITEERRARAEADARAQAAQALEFVGDGVFLVDADGIVRLWNRAAEAITGSSPHRRRDGRHRGAPGWEELAVRIRSPLVRRGADAAADAAVRDRRAGAVALDLGRAFPHGTVYAFRDLTEERASSG
jgi:PAS domain-containing protein